jgi:cold shock CspA family protein
MATDKVTSSTPESLTGRVKWFNNKTGYGFITVADGARAGTDIFVHHTAVNVSEQQYKYLVQGEYVEFVLTTVEGGKHPFQASKVSGIKGGRLMCETRNEFKSARKSYKSEPDTEKSVSSEQESTADKTPVAKTPRSRGEGPRDQTWTTVKSAAPKRKPRAPRASSEAK